jgi:hypothetical protein
MILEGSWKGLIDLNINTTEEAATLEAVHTPDQPVCGMNAEKMNDRDS